MGVTFSNNQLNYSVQNSNAVIIAIGQQAIAFGQSSSWDFGIDTQPLYEIGSLKPQEIQQLRSLPSINIDAFMLTAAGLKLAGYSSDISYFIMNNSFNIFLYDSASSASQLTTNSVTQTNVLYVFSNAVASGFSFSVPSNAPVSQTLTFYAEDVFGSDEQTSLLSSNSALQTAVTTVAKVGSLV